jgi:arsenite-transporting ATPase
MSNMMGGEAGSQEDMFAKLDAMRAVITEVNTQFKDPVSDIDNNRITI